MTDSSPSLPPTPADSPSGPRPVPVRRTVHRWGPPAGCALEREAGYSAPDWNGAELRRRREARGLTLADLAASAGYSSDAFARWERNERTPPADVLALIACAWGCSMRAFFRPRGPDPARKPSDPGVDARSETQ